MSRAVETTMFLAVLAVVAFSLQGCAPSEHLEQYKNAAKGMLQTAGTKAVTKLMEAAHACPPLLASIQPKKEELVQEVLGKVVSAEICKEDLKGPECQEAMSFELADTTMFYAENDPGFQIWIKDHEDKWDPIKGMVNGVLQGEFMEPVKVMQELEECKDVGSADFKAFATVQFKDIIDATMEVFCPTDPAAVQAALANDAPLVKAADATAKANEKAKEAALKEEVLAIEAAKTAEADEPKAVKEAEKDIVTTAKDAEVILEAKATPAPAATGRRLEDDIQI